MFTTFYRLHVMVTLIHSGRYCFSLMTLPIQSGKFLEPVFVVAKNQVIKVYDFVAYGGVGSRKILVTYWELLFWKLFYLLIQNLFFVFFLIEFPLYVYYSSKIGSLMFLSFIFYHNHLVQTRAEIIVIFTRKA